SRIRLSDKTSRLHPWHVVPKPRQTDEAVALVQVQDWEVPALASSDVVLDAQPPAQPHRGVVVERAIRLADGADLEIVRPSAQRTVQHPHQLRGLLPCHRMGRHRMDFLDHALDAFLRWPESQVPLASLRRMHPPKRISQEVELVFRHFT